VISTHGRVRTMVSGQAIVYNRGGSKLGFELIKREESCHQLTASAELIYHMHSYTAQTFQRLLIQYRTTSGERFQHCHFLGPHTPYRPSLQGDYNGVVTSDLIHRQNGRRFLTPLVCAGCLLTGSEAASLGKSGGVRLRSARVKAASNPVSRQPALTSGVKKCLPFFMRVVTPL